MTELTLTLTDMAHGGLALGRDKSGRAVFVPFAIPGETVRVRSPPPGDRAARAELLAVVKPSPDRVAPRCRHFGICGNCAFQHMGYDAQLRAKTAVVRDQLSRVGGIRNPDVRPILPHPAAYDYRGETTLFRADEGGWLLVAQRCGASFASKSAPSCSRRYRRRWPDWT
jgi:23S rRNA (uracil1939-C5)-methyltransferase